MSPFVRPALVRRGDRRLARSVFFLLLGLYTATFAGLPDNPDAEVEFLTAKSLAQRGSLALDPADPMARLAIEAGHGVRPGGPEREGEHFAWFGIGQALVALPFYGIGSGLHELFPEYELRHRESSWYGAPQSAYFEHLLVGWRNALLGALTAMLVVASARRIGASRPHAWIAGLSYGIATFAWPQACSSLSDVQATFLLFLAFHQILAARERLEALRAPRRLDLALGGSALALAFLTRVVTAPAVAVLVVCFVVVLVPRRRRLERAGSTAGDLAAFVLPAIAGLGAFLWLNARRFGDPLETGYGEAVFSGTYFSFPPLHGLASLLLSPGKGLLWMAPGVLLVVVWSIVQHRGRDPLVFWTVVAVCVAVIAPIAPTQGWHGAHTYGPRYLLPLLPFVWLGVGPALDAAARRPLLRTCAFGALAAGLLTSLPGVLVGYGTHHDLAVRAARTAWPALEGSPAEQEEERFQRIHWSWRFAAPWAHWRILRHRVAGLGEDFPVREIFYLDFDQTLAPAHERDQGFHHVAWVDFRERLRGPVWPFALVCTASLLVGLVAALRALDPGAP